MDERLETTSSWPKAFEGIPSIDRPPFLTVIIPSNFIEGHLELRRE
jgi:hypothetical protein